MIRSLILPAVICLVSSSPVSAQQVIEGHYGRQNLDVAYAAAATNDGGYIITGLTRSGTDPNGDIIVIKTSMHGDTVWSHTYGGPNLEGGNFVMQTADGGYMVSGHTQDFGANDCDAFLLKLDQYGNNEWIKTYGGDSDDISESVVALSDGGYVIGGITASYGNTGISINRHVYFVKTNSAGDTVWTKVYAGANNEECYSITGMADGGFLAVGWSNSWGNGADYGWLLRLNESGDTLWTRFYENNRDTRLYKILPTLDNGFIIAGSITPGVPGLGQGLAIKLDANGNEMWKKTYNDINMQTGIHDVAQLPTGNFLFAGSTTSSSNPTGSVYILTTDINGDKITDETCGGTNSYANAIAVQGNNSYLVAGAATKYGDPDEDLYFSENDNTMPAHVSTPGAAWPRLFPNPVREQPAIIVLPASEANQSVQIDITTNDGRCVFSKTNVLAKDIVIDRTNFPPAQYRFQINCKDGAVYKGSFVVE